jgi:hypothetical protein
MSRFLVFLFCLSIHLNGFAFAEIPFKDDSMQVVLPPDTIPPRKEMLEEFAEDGEDLEEASDSTEEETYEEVWDDDQCLLINCDLYASVWDTTRINPYGVNMKTRKDTNNLRLVFNSSCDYSHPAGGVVTSDFGFRRTRYHYGIDIDLETGDPVVAAFEGTVRVARYSTSYGNYVIIRHLNGLETLYAHLSKLLVKSGEYLQAGDALGLGGNTGKSRGSHLHFEVRFLGQQINPRDIISFENQTCMVDSICISPASFSYLNTVEKHKAQQAAAKYYKIKKGDTLGKIARRYRTTVKKICKLNRISSRTVLKPGRRLRVA